jgi:hypothetical protein
MKLTAAENIPEAKACVEELDAVLKKHGYLLYATYDGTLEMTTDPAYGVHGIESPQDIFVRHRE